MLDSEMRDILKRAVVIYQATDSEAHKYRVYSVSMDGVKKGTIRQQYSDGAVFASPVNGEFAPYETVNEAIYTLAVGDGPKKLWQIAGDAGFRITHSSTGDTVHCRLESEVLGRIHYQIHRHSTGSFSIYIDECGLHLQLDNFRTLKDLKKRFDEVFSEIDGRLKNWKWGTSPDFDPPVDIAIPRFRVIASPDFTHWDIPLIEMQFKNEGSLLSLLNSTLSNLHTLGETVRRAIAAKDPTET